MYCRCLALLAFASLLIGSAPLAAQLEPPSSGGAVQLAQSLRMLGHYKRVLMIGAHPDDEDTELLTVLVRGEGAEAAYLSLNRGEGGQNLIGSELGVGLGVLRSEELLAARQLDGARQFFTRAYDFGYSKSLADTWTQWTHDSLLKDVVRIVRRFRPQVIVSVFSGTPRDGHGQHQAAGVLAQEAFSVAADSSAFRELQLEEGLAPWAAQKLYRSTRFDTTATTVRLDGGALEPAAGRTYHQIAMASRSRHRSQDMGQLQTIGASVVRLELLQVRRVGRAGQGEPGGQAGQVGQGERVGQVRQDSVRPPGAERSFWEGVDTSLAALPGFSQATDADRAEVQALLQQARRASPGDTSVAPLLVRVASLLRAGHGSVEVDDQLTHVGRAWQAATGVVLDARLTGHALLSGTNAELTIEASGPATILRSGKLVPAVPFGAVWPSISMDSQIRGESGRGTALSRIQVSVPAGQPQSNPYYLTRGFPNGMYDWHDVPPAWRGLPFEPDPVSGTMAIPNAPFRLMRPATRRRNDQARGELRDPVEVVARVDVAVSPRSVAWAATDRSLRPFDVTLTHGASDTTKGKVRLELPEGWPPVPPQPFALSGDDAQVTLRFNVRPPGVLRPGRVTIRAVATDAQGATYDQGRITVAYEHVRARSYLEPAAADVSIMNLKLPALARVGYVRGAADRVPEALSSAGVPIRLLDGRMLATDRLDGYDVIVIGPRAYETEPQLLASNSRLLDYVRRGGVLIVQYQQYGFFTGNYAPYPLFVASRAPGTTTANVTTSRGGAVTVGTTGGHDRVTDERAPVQLLDATAPELTSPNRIGASDWDGWVQERGLYFARAWDKRYRTLIEMHDAGEGPLEGGMLVTNVGEGKYVYTGIAFFRQLPAGVPGAFRLFANLLALGGRSR